MNNKIYVFGSNLAGRHGKGSAKYAREHYGAIYGQGHGLQGQSYAIPTKDANIKTLPLKVIANYVGIFLKFAQEHPEMQFRVSAIGCGLAGYLPKDIAPLFMDVITKHIQNVELPERFTDWLQKFDHVAGSIRE